MHSWFSLASVLTIGALLTTTWILPLLNLHIALSKETSLQERAQVIVDANRLHRADTVAALRSIDLPGINIKGVAEEMRGDYVIYQLSFSHSGLFTNPFLSREDLEQEKAISLLSDLI